MKKNIVLFIFLLLSAIGLEYETQAYTTGSMSGTSYGIVGLSALLALLYIIPALLLIRQLGKKWQTPAVSLGVALLGGLFISGWTSGLAGCGVRRPGQPGAPPPHVNPWREPSLRP